MNFGPDSFVANSQDEDSQFFSRKLFDKLPVLRQGMKFPQEGKSGRSMTNGDKQQNKPQDSVPENVHTSVVPHSTLREGAGFNESGVSGGAGGPPDGPPQRSFGGDVDDSDEHREEAGDTSEESSLNLSAGNGELALQARIQSSATSECGGISDAPTAIASDTEGHGQIITSRSQRSRQVAESLVGDTGTDTSSLSSFSGPESARYMASLETRQASQVPPSQDLFDTKPDGNTQDLRLRLSQSQQADLCPADNSCVGPVISNAGLILNMISSVGESQLSNPHFQLDRPRNNPTKSSSSLIDISGGTEVNELTVEDALKPDLVQSGTSHEPRILADSQIPSKVTDRSTSVSATEHPSQKLALPKSSEIVESRPEAVEESRVDQTSHKKYLAGGSNLHQQESMMYSHSRMSEIEGLAANKVNQGLVQEAIQPPMVQEASKEMHEAANMDESLRAGVGNQQRNDHVQVKHMDTVSQMGERMSLGRAATFDQDLIGKVMGPPHALPKTYHTVRLRTVFCQTLTFVEERLGTQTIKQTITENKMETINQSVEYDDNGSISPSRTTSTLTSGDLADISSLSRSTSLVSSKLSPGSHVGRSSLASSRRTTGSLRSSTSNGSITSVRPRLSDTKERSETSGRQSRRQTNEDYTILENAREQMGTLGRHVSPNSQEENKTGRERPVSDSQEESRSGKSDFQEQNLTDKLGEASAMQKENKTGRKRPWSDSQEESRSGKLLPQSDFQEENLTDKLEEQAAMQKENVTGKLRHKFDMREKDVANTQEGRCQLESRKDLAKTSDMEEEGETSVWQKKSELVKDAKSLSKSGLKKSETTKDRGTTIRLSKKHDENTAHSSNRLGIESDIEDKSLVSQKKQGMRKSAKKKKVPTATLR